MINLFQTEVRNLRRNIDFTFILLIAFLAYNSFRSGAFSDPMSWLMDTLMYLPAIIIGLSFHEFAHALVAYKLGDPTPKIQGRVTINPAAHIDIIGLAALIFCGFGWGKPVMIDPRNFRNRRRDELLVSLAGVVMNLIIAVVFSFVAKVILLTAGAGFATTDSLGMIIWKMINYIILINLVLMIFNLIPCPPLDGFSIISELFDIKHTGFYWTLYRYGDWILVALIVFGITGRIISPCVNFLYYNILMNYVIL